MVRKSFSVLPPTSKPKEDIFTPTGSARSVRGYIISNASQSTKMGKYYHVNLRPDGEQAQCIDGIFTVQDGELYQVTGVKEAGIPELRKLDTASVDYVTLNRLLTSTDPGSQDGVHAVNVENIRDILYGK